MAARTEEVLVVGAGPTGLALAAELKRLGVNPIVFDRCLEGANTSRATVVHARTLEVLETLGISDTMVAQGRILHRGLLRAKGGEIKATIPFDGLPTKYSFALVLPQDRTETILLEKLRELGGGVHRAVEVNSLTQTADQVTVTYTAGNVLVQEIGAKWVVGCDGLHSAVRQAAGIAFSGGEYDESFVLADVQMDWPPAPQASAESLDLFLDDGGLTMVAPLPNGNWRIIATMENAPQHPDAALCQRLLDERTVAGARVTGVAWSTRFHIQHRVARKLRQGRVLIAGDAAHVHSPAGGQGMNTGIQDAVSLAEALVKALRTGDESALTAWESARLKIANSVVSTTDTMTRLATGGGMLTHVLRDAALALVGHIPALQHAVARRLSELDNR